MIQAERPLNIFIVENHPDTATYMRLYLEQLGHRATVATSIKAALAEIRSADVDLLISDIGLPDGDGWELLRQLKTERPVFAVAMSGFGSPADKSRSQAAGFRHHLTKPFLPEELDSILLEVQRETNGVLSKN